jgi:Uma2 family endonuclease
VQRRVVWLVAWSDWGFPSTEAYDRGKKFKLYRQSSSLIEYVLVNADEIEIDVFRKNDRGRWEETNYVPGDLVELESIDLTFPIDRVYRGIKFDSESTKTIIQQ